MATIEETFKSIYYKADHPAGYSSAEKLYQYASKINPQITLAKTKDWLSGEITYTLHKQARRKWRRNKVRVYGIDELWMADLTFMDGFEENNQGFRYILTVIDCFSKYAWAKPLKTKQATEVKKALIEIFKERKPLKLQTDKGGEFDNKMLRSFFKKQQIFYFTTHSPEIKCSMVERFNKTLKNKMFKLFTHTGQKVWYNRIDELLKSYNNSRHRSTNFAPSEVNIYNSHHVLNNLYKDEMVKQEPKLMTGDNVRVKYKLNTFDRGFYPYWEDVIETVGNNIAEEKPRYSLQKPEVTKDRPDVKRRYYPEELQKVKPVLYRIEILKSRKTKKKGKEYFVRWLGYNKTEWISENQVQNMNQ